ncbi:site-2 protease family protein [Brevibacillus daliensis]|uniref:site-2 protease family protein n=1 Tax=Brevibacillus daliensis TaxID=2892995 RepID=UPI001E3194A2|nr:site-2 protease family protein [Brevibacillus daliensis]
MSVNPKTKKANRSIFIVIGLFLLTKAKTLLALLKFSKFGATFISMGVALYVYAVFFGWQFGVALIYLIMIHELGHVIAARIKGIKVSMPFFIPFVGAFINLKELPRDAKTESFLALGGPFAGLLSFLPAIPLYYYTQEPIWLLVVYLGSFINLINLMPVSPLDGGRIVAVLSPNLWFLGLLIMAVFIFYSPNPLMILIFIMGLFTWYNHLKSTSQAETMEYERNKWLEWKKDLTTWMESPLSSEERLVLQREVNECSKTELKKPFSFPLFGEDKKIEHQKLVMDRFFLFHKWETLTKHEKEEYMSAWNQYAYRPDGDTEQLQTENTENPAPTVLQQELQRANEKSKKLDEELSHIQNYYKASSSTRWKVLITYVLLSTVLAGFYYYSNTQLDVVLRSIMP